jgi:membrane protein
MSRTAALDLLKTAWTRWNSVNAPRLGASLAYYSLLSMAPLLIVLVAICGLVLNKSTAQADVISQAQQLTGPKGAATVQMLIDNARHTGSGVFATSVAFLTLLLGASGVFNELRDSLNIIWDASARSSGSTWRTMLMQRLVSFGMVLALGFLLLVSLIASAALAIVEGFFAQVLPFNLAIAGEVSNALFSLLSIAALFALILKFVPDVSISWRDVSIGAILTALLFTVGKILLSLYLTTAGVGSTYGAAGSVVALVVWVYYSAQIFFFGATLTRAYAERFGSLVGKRSDNRRFEVAVSGAKRQQASA